MDWDEMARPWLEAAPDLEVSFRDVFELLFAAARLEAGEKVLDVGCGTGPTLLAASEAVGGTGRVLGVDVAPPLVARAAERVPGNVDLVVADAGSHAYESEAFDAVIANFGIMFFEDNAVAFRNLRKAVRRGGRLAATVWATPDVNPWFSMPRRIVDEHVADVPRPDPAGPGPMRFGDPSILEDHLVNSGWKPEIRSVDVHLHPPGTAERVADLHMKVTAGMMLKGVDVADSELERIRKAIADASRAYETEGFIRVPAKIHVVSAVAC
ncbi:class I SAM-dependent methyltransferase [Hoeflea sp.]|uniref:class I SAM-dependent methyltransferase n=1 Tax=Hoeflea sp. TaxID=1940281 RepID=UPI003B01C058